MDDVDAFFARSFLIDEADWAHLSGEAKVHAQTASFTLPHLDGQQMPDIDEEETHHGWMVNGVTEMAMKVKKANTSKRPVKNRGRKEATATDLRTFMKQFQKPNWLKSRAGGTMKSMTWLTFAR